MLFDISARNLAYQSSFDVSARILTYQPGFWRINRAPSSALMPLRSQREPAGSASASRWLRQHSASASRWLRSLAPCMHSATLRQRFALAPRSSSPQSALRAACCDPRCLHTGPLNPRCSRAPRGCCHGDRLRVLSLCNRSWNFGSMSLELGI